MVKPTTIDAFFKRKHVEVETSQPQSMSQSVDQQSDAPGDSSNLNSGSQPRKVPRIDKNENFDINSLERDPGLRLQIWDYPIDKRDEIRRAYIKAGPYQIILSKYPKSKEKHPRSFQSSWFRTFPSWLEYSRDKDAAFCLPCYLFRPQYGPSGIDAFTINGFQSWKKVRDGKKCALLAHVGKDTSSFHRNAERACEDLINQSQHIVQRFERHTSEQIIENRLRLEVSINVAKLLAFQGCAFRGHDETKDSLNGGNFKEFLNLIAFYNDKVAKVIANAPRNATYTSPRVQKEILHVFSTKVMKVIRDEIADAKFCLIVDEARDESKCEQMSIVLRFVDKDGYVRERFFGLVHVKDTAAVTLKEAIFDVLSHHNLDVQNIRGQGYDGASNMRGEWNGLQALILRDCPSAYYVHCMAHRLQLALVAASREVIPVHHFFTKLNSIINIVGSSCKRNDQLKAAHASNIAFFLANNDLQSGKGKNQIGALQRPGETRWSSYLKSVSSLLKMFSATCEVLLNIIEDGVTPTQRGDADAAYEALTSFEFVLILHIMKNILEITDLLCQALQNKAQDILNALQLVSSTKLLIQKLRDEGWDKLLSDVKSFCESVNIPMLDLDVRYVARKGRARRQEDNFTVEHHYKVDIFFAVLDSQLQELNNRFNEHTTELLVLSSALDPKEMLISYRIDDIEKLVQKFYPRDFAEFEMAQLRMQFEHFEREIASTINVDSVIDDFRDLKERRSLF